MQTKRIWVEDAWSPSRGSIGPAILEVCRSQITRLETAPTPPTSCDIYRNVTCIPGLIDTHVHLCFAPGDADVLSVVRGSRRSDLIAHAVRNARSAAKAGVTTLRDAGDTLGVVRAVTELGDLLGPGFPTLQTVGPPLTIRGGHCDFLGGIVERGSAAEPAVAALAAEGVDAVKIMLSGGILTPGSDAGDLQFGEGWVRSAVGAAHAYNLPVAVHAHSGGAIEIASRAGADSIEHCTFQEAGPTYRFTDGALRELGTARNRLFVCPTTCNRPGVVQQQERLLWRMGVIERLYKMGLRLVAGTDAGVLPGLEFDSVPFAIQTLIDSGVDWDSALRAATSTAAECLGLRRKGDLLPGYDADLVLLGSPPANMSALEVERVLVKGQWI